MINANSGAGGKHCASFRQSPNASHFPFVIPDAQKERRPAPQGSSQLQDGGQGHPPVVPRGATFSHAGPCPPPAGRAHGSYSFPSVKLLRRNKVPTSRKFGIPLLLRQDRENVTRKIMSGPLKDRITTAFPGVRSGT